MPDERFAEHLEHPVGRGHEPAAAFAGAAGGAVCGDLVTIRLAVDGTTVIDAGFDASGCGAAQASGSAVVDLIRGASIFDAARIGSPAVADALGGLSVGKLHAADLASDALHQALGAAVAHGAHDPSATPNPRRTLVAMSGGVDSSVAAVLQGATHDEVVAVTLELWRDPENDAEASCCSASAVRTARAIAHQMGLPHFTLDLRDGFRAGVVDPWLAEHAAGLTPNPCVRCNGHVRLDAMVAFADRIGAATLATGHYARRTDDGLLRAAADGAKDQTYMLAALSRATLARLRFPLGELTKPEVRALAREHDLPVADKADSQDLCFLAGTGRERFLARHGGLTERPGDVLDQDGNTLGTHRGHFHYTVGQRRGLPVQRPEPLYVLDTDARSNTITLGPRAALDVTHVALRGVRLHTGDPARVDGVRLRSHARIVPCRLEPNAVVLDEPFSAPAPGQTAVLLSGDVVIGCATIAS
ncbi:MAG TPA: tRNA 2-thiouridine(34) synthase MnmA [Baekduia sp.]